MNDDSLKKRLVRNEEILRDQNNGAGKGIKRYFRDDQEASEAPVAFICECSILDCDEHVNTSIDCYEQLHERNDHFTIYPGHDVPTIEKIVSRHKGFVVVQKFAVGS